MREILFRGKAEVNNEWVFGDLLHIKEKPFIRTECGTQFLVRPETVGQYTGLTDSGDEKIFEGDVLQFPAFEIAGEKFPEYFEKVVWGDGGWEAQSELGADRMILDKDTADETIIVDTVCDAEEART